MKPDGKAFKDLFLYLIVGGLATVVEWALFWVLSGPLGVQYLLATALAFAASTFANWAFGRLLVFKDPGEQSLLRELAAIYLASVVGLLLNLVIMYVLVQLCALPEMLSKMAATVLVFAYNYLVRKKLIYQQK